MQTKRNEIEKIKIWTVIREIKGGQQWRSKKKSSCNENDKGGENDYNER